MMKKQHGPAFRKQMIELVQCPVCRGRAVIEGVFHEMACVQCNASGWLSAATGEALPLEELVTQLNMRLQIAQAALQQLSRPAMSGPAAQYEQNNRRGAGGSNFTGD
jgi:hypothetical protein